MTPRLAPVLLCVAFTVLAPSAAADDGTLRRALAELVPRAEAVAGLRGSADKASAAQLEYDAARALGEALRRSLPVSRECLPSYEAAEAYAAALVKEAEGVDRVRPGLTRAAAVAAQRALAGYRRALPACEATQGAALPVVPQLTRPAPHDVSFGERFAVEGAAPRGATTAVVGVGRRPRCGSTGMRVVAGRLGTSVSAPAGRHVVQVAYCSRAGTLLGRTRAQPFWLLPVAAAVATPPRRPDAALSARLAQAAQTFDGYSAVWFHDLATGRSAAWNADARFPAASTVKLALLVAALGRHGVGSPLEYDLAAMATWSSNLATNRLLTKLGSSEAGGAEIVQRSLLRLGAAQSTFTGGYRVSTAAGRSDAAAPPAVSSRVTTARDLGRILFLLHAGAGGDRDALQTLGLRRAEARHALGLLLDSEPDGDNVGLLRPVLPDATPAAQKHGWFSLVRHTAAVVYESGGPRIVVVLTYRDGLTLGAAQRYARSVLRSLGD